MTDDVPDLTGDRGFQTVREGTYRALFVMSAVLSVLTTLAILLSLLGDAVGFFANYSIVEFLTGTNWSPGIKPLSFGVIPLVYGTLIVTLGSALIALPVGVLTAIYLSEYADDEVRAVLKPALEILAGVPSVVYGYFALVYITPALSVVFPTISTFNALSASIVVGIMIIPMVASISEDAMNAVPDSLRQAGYGLGATKFDVSTQIVVPAAISGIVSSFILAFSRAIGETMAVTIAMGARARLPDVSQLQVFGASVPFVHPADIYLKPAQAMTAAMVQLGGSDVTGASLAYNSLFAIGLTLFVITLTMNVISDIIAERYREEY